MKLDQLVLLNQLKNVLSMIIRLLFVVLIRIIDVYAETRGTSGESRSKPNLSLYVVNSVLDMRVI